MEIKRGIIASERAGSLFGNEAGNCVRMKLRLPKSRLTRPGVPDGRCGMARERLGWILVLTAGASLAAHATAATEAQCRELLQRALESKNPDIRKQAVAALSLTGNRGPLFDTLEHMLAD